MNKELTTLVQESYFGKTETLLQCEEIIQQMMDVYKVKQNVDMTNHILNRKLRLLFQKQFGFKEVYINWYRSGFTNGKPNAQENAFTYFSAFILWDTSMRNYSALDGRGKGYYDEKHSNVLTIEISYQHAILGNYTAGEILAVMLHEIGHNFDRSPYNYYSLLMRTFIMFNNWMIVGRQWKYLKNPDNHITEEMLTLFQKNLAGAAVFTIAGTAPMKAFQNLINQIAGKLFDIVPFASAIEHLGVQFVRIRDHLKDMDPRSLMYRILWIKEVLDTNPLMLPKKWLSLIPSKKKEIFSDSFAAAYGYGPELASSMAKSDTTEWFELKEVFSEFPGLSILSDLKLFHWYLMNTIVDPSHGTSVERMHKIMKDLEIELRSNHQLDPALRAQLEKDYQESKALLEEYMQQTKEDKLYISAATQWFLVNICGGNSFLLEKLLPDTRA